jgi:hypothetical protein
MANTRIISTQIYRVVILAMIVVIIILVVVVIVTSDADLLFGIKYKKRWSHQKLFLKRKHILQHDDTDDRNENKYHEKKQKYICIYTSIDIDERP